MATVYEGRILTVDAIDSVARFLVEEKGLIAYVGNDLPEKYGNCERVDLGDDVLAPAFVDTHAHLDMQALVGGFTSASEAGAISEVLDCVRSCAQAGRMPVAAAFGASDHLLEEGRLPNKAEMDSACPERPAMVIRYDGHACVANTKLIEAIGAGTGDLDGFHGESGLLEGEAFAKALRLARESVPQSVFLGGIQDAIDRYAAHGFCLAGNSTGFGMKWNADISFARWIAKSLKGGFQLRVWPQSQRPAVALKSKIARVGGCFEPALDGTFGGRDAALRVPYCGDGGNKGCLRLSDEQVEEFCFQAHNHKLQVALHAVGDAAFDQAARCLARTIDRSFKEAHRHGIIHACLPTEEGLDLCARYGFHLMMQPSFIAREQEPEGYLRTILGESRARGFMPLRTIWDKGISVSAGSDAPCTQPDAIEWMYRACNHPESSQSLTAREALRMCTINGAWVTYDEDEFGSLEEGKVASMVRLSANPYEVPASELRSIQVKQTILYGRPYAPVRLNPASVMAKGLLTYGYC